MRMRRPLHRVISRTILFRRLSSSANIHRTSSKHSTFPKPIRKRSGRNQRGPHKVVSDSYIVRCNIAITSHMRDGQCGVALKLFDSMTLRTSITWNTMISGYLSNGQFELARKMFEDMPYRDRVSWNVMISGYVKNGDLGAAKQLFDQMPDRDVVSWNAILSGYAQNGLVDEAWRLFCAMPVKNEISWNGILAAYVQNGKMEEASRLFESKGSWAVVSWNCLMGGYLRKRRFAEARGVFDRMPERDKVSWNTMISCYAQNGEMDMARKLFDESPVRDVFTWTAMVSGYVQNGMLDEARRIFDEMPEKNAVSWNAMIAGYVQSKNVELAWELFEDMLCRNISSWNTMITCFAQNGDTARARSLFDSMPHRDCISWSAIIGGYVQNGESEEALHMYVEMERQGERMNSSSFTCMLSMCADIAALELGKQIHGQVFKAGFESGCYVGNAVLAMYCKCGSIEEAYDVFQSITDKDIVSWNTIINGYARHGFSNEALKVFEAMQKAGTGPDEVTMVGVLSACSHTGLIDTGRSYFDSMPRDYGIMPNSKHYTCMIDLLGRAGHLDDAQKLMKDMPFEADAATWGALLGASRLHGNAELGEKAAEMIFILEPWNAGMYVLLSNLYASSGRWPEVRKMRLKMRDSGVRKVRGYSWVEVQNKIHTFSVGDSTHHESHRIYAFLEELDLRLKHEGFVSSPKLVLHDVEDEEKEQMLKYHSEKLAVAFAILTIPAGRPIRVIKNLRVCEDCHTAIKYISKIVGRIIIVRDSNRFHHFRDGVCSCGDYW